MRASDQIDVEPVKLRTAAGFYDVEYRKLGTNPKDLLGVKKPSFSKIPPVALAHESLAMMDGAGKYGDYNWRGNKVQADIYVDACMRHLLAWFEGEEVAEDSGCHHLGHARACLAILLDAQATGNLVDNRPNNTSSAFKKVMEEVASKIPAMNERHKKFHQDKKGRVPDGSGPSL